MSQLSFPFELIDVGGGIETEAPSAKCQCSNVDPENDGPVSSDAFYVFWDIRFNPPHLHIQCFDCEQSYCPYGLCVPPPTAEVIGAG